MKTYTVKTKGGNYFTGVVTVNNERGMSLETSTGHVFLTRNIIDGVVLDGEVHPDSNFP